MSRKLRAVVVLALIGLISAGCGANASGGTGTTSTGATDRDQGVKFAQCMRENGIPDFPDPDASGDFDYGISVSEKVWTTAVDACKDLKPPGTFSTNRNAEQQAAALKFAQCIRANGVTDFPDPVNGEPIINTNKIPSTDRAGGMTILNAAIEKCRTDSPAGTGKKP